MLDPTSPGTTTTTMDDDRKLARARPAIIAVFFLNGLTLGSFIVRAPSLKADHHLDNGEVGVIELAFALAAIVSMQFVGSLVARFGSAPLLRTCLVVMTVLLTVVGLTGGVIEYTIAVMALGAVHGITDTAMNAHAVAVERLNRRPVLSSSHAAWSISAVLASLVGALLVRLGVPTAGHFLGVGILVAGAAFVVGPFLLPPVTDQRGQAMASAATTDPPRASWRTGWTRPLLLLGVTGTVLMVCEGAALGWGAIFLRDSRGASLAVASIAVTAYSGGQTAGRTIGDRLKTRCGARRVFRTGGLIAAAGLAVAVLSPRPAVALVGFAVYGIGGSVLLPLTYSAVGQVGGSGPGAAVFVSRFTTFAYGGALLGPALIGSVAQQIGLTWTLAGLIPLLSLVAVLSRLPQSSPQPEPS